MTSARDRRASQESKRSQNEQLGMCFSLTHGRTGQSVSRWFPSSSHPTHIRRSSGTSKPKNFLHPALRVVLSVSLPTFFAWAGHKSHRYPQNATLFLVIIPPVLLFLRSYPLDVAVKTKAVMTADDSPAGRTAPFFLLRPEEVFHAFCLNL